MRGQTKMDYFKNETKSDFLKFRMLPSEKDELQKKAKSEGLTLSKCIRCFVIGYLSGDLLAQQLIEKYREV